MDAALTPAARGLASRLLGLALLAAAMLLAQVALTRVLAIAQGYHFAFLVISLALLGFGASGSLLAVVPRLGRPGALPWYAIGYGASVVGAYLFLNHVPFDAYAIARDPGQVWLLVADLLALAVPFLFAGLLIGSLLSAYAASAGRLYGADLLGSGSGALAAPLVLDAVGSERALLLAGALGVAAGAVLAAGRAPRVVAVGALVGGIALVAAVPQPFELRPSQYKRLSALRRDPDTRVLVTRQDATSRLDIVTNPTIRSAPGLSLAYSEPLPPQAGLVLDAEDLLPVADASRTPPALARSLPVAVALEIAGAPDAALVLGSGGGGSARSAVAYGARSVTVVEPNRLVHDALVSDLRTWAGLADDPRVRLVRAPLRSFVAADTHRYDLVELTLTEAYRPASSGAFTLTEDYRLTRQAVAAYLERTDADGALVVTRWAQVRPAESLRTLAIIAEVLGARDPLQHVIAFRSFQTVTFVVKPTPLTPAETDRALATIDRLRYDLVLAPRMPEGMLNRYARVPSPEEHETALAFLRAPDRGAFLRGYELDVTSPSDDRPFFFHFLRLEDTPRLLEELGRRWQPFGGSGTFVLVGLLGFAAAAAALFVLAPLVLRRPFRRALREMGSRRSARTLAYFSAIGLAFLLVEVALIQRAILVLGAPTLALATVLGSLLVASGAGSLLSTRVPQRASTAVLAALLLVQVPLGSALAPALLALPEPMRALSVAALTAPVGFLMGVPFPAGIRALGSGSGAPLIPWAWAANGAASVISGVAAAMLALVGGFSSVLVLAAALYLLAALLGESARQAAPAEVTGRAVLLRDVT